MRKDWSPFLLEIICYRERDVVATSDIFEGAESSNKDEYEGEIDWG